MSNTQEPKKEKCMFCNGIGRVNIFKLNDGSISGYGYYWHAPPKKCSRCNGSGWIVISPATK